MSLWRRIYLERRGVLLPLLVAIVANVAVLVFGVLPLRQAVASAEDAALDAKTNLSKAQIIDRNAKEARTRKTDADQQLKKFYAEVLPHDFPTARNLVSSWALRTASASHLKLKAGGWEFKDIRDSHLTKVTGKVTLTGDYSDIRRFLYAVETAQEFIIVEQVSLANTQQGGLSNGSLDVELNVATYCVRGES